MATVTPGNYVFKGADATNGDNAYSVGNTNGAITSKPTKLHKVVGTPLNISADNYKITGTISVEGVPSRRMVYIAKSDKLDVFLAGTYSRSSDGYFEFLYLENGTYTVYAVDDVNGLNTVVYSRVQSVSM